MQIQKMIFVMLSGINGTSSYARPLGSIDETSDGSGGGVTVLAPKRARNPTMKRAARDRSTVNMGIIVDSIARAFHGVDFLLARVYTYGHKAWVIPSFLLSGSRHCSLAGAGTLKQNTVMEGQNENMTPGQEGQENVPAAAPAPEEGQEAGEGDNA